MKGGHLQCTFQSHGLSSTLKKKKTTHTFLSFPILAYTWIMNKAVQLKKAGTRRRLDLFWQSSQTKSPSIPEPGFEEVGAREAQSPTFSPESSPWVVRVIGLGASEEDGGRGGLGDENVCAFRDHADGRSGSNFDTNTIVAVHHGSLDLNLRDQRQGGISRESKQMLPGSVHVTPALRSTMVPHSIPLRMGLERKAWIYYYVSLPKCTVT